MSAPTTSTPCGKCNRCPCPDKAPPKATVTCQCARKHRKSEEPKEEEPGPRVENYTCRRERQSSEPPPPLPQCTCNAPQKVECQCPPPEVIPTMFCPPPTIKNMDVVCGRQSTKPLTNRVQCGHCAGARRQSHPQAKKKCTIQ